MTMRRVGVTSYAMLSFGNVMTESTTMLGGSVAAASRTLTGGRPTPLWRTRVFPLGLFYAAIFLFFAVIWFSGAKDSPLNVATAGVFLSIRLLGAGIGFWKLHRAGFDRHQPAHWMLLALSLSLLFGAFGTVIWLTYNLTGVLVPYPSLGDAAFGGHTLLWVAGLFCFFAVLDTSPREELGPFLGLLTATWSLTVLLISLIQGARVVTVQFPKIAFDVFYPAMWALNCALVGSLLLGPRYRQLTKAWRGFIVFAYTGALVLFLTNIAYGITAAIPADSTAAGYLYYNGGPLDFLFATGNFFLFLGIVVLPLGQPVFRLDTDVKVGKETKQGMPVAALVAQPPAAAPPAEVVAATALPAASPTVPAATPPVAAHTGPSAIVGEAIQAVLTEVERLRAELGGARRPASTRRRQRRGSPARRVTAFRPAARPRRPRARRFAPAGDGTGAAVSLSSPRARWTALHRRRRISDRRLPARSPRRARRVVRRGPEDAAATDRSTVLNGAVPP